jgi:hypothetical protein
MVWHWNRKNGGPPRKRRIVFSRLALDCIYSELARTRVELGAQSCTHLDTNHAPCRPSTLCHRSARALAGTCGARAICTLRTGHAHHALPPRCRGPSPQPRTCSGACLREPARERGQYMYITRCVVTANGPYGSAHPAVSLPLVR